MRLIVDTNSIIAALLRDGGSRKTVEKTREKTVEKIIRLVKENPSITQEIDSEDTPFIALAVENDGIWSDDRHFMQQTVVKVWTTKDLLRLFGRI